MLSAAVEICRAAESCESVTQKKKTNLQDVGTRVKRPDIESQQANRSLEAVPSGAMQEGAEQVLSSNTFLLLFYDVRLQISYL